MTANSAPPPPATSDDALVVEDQLFSIVPEWVIDSGIPDAAFRVYALLLRYGNGSGVRMPSRATLAGRLGRSTDAVDRAMRTLEAEGLVVVERRRRGGVNLSNRYFVRTAPPAPVTDQPSSGGSRTSTATLPGIPGGDTAPPQEMPPVMPGGGRTSAATGRTSAATVAADPRPDPEISTQRRTPPPPPSPAPRAARRAAQEEAEFLSDLNLDPNCGLLELATRCTALRAAHGLGATCWQPQHLLAALQLAVRGRLWPARFAVSALERVASDPATRSPMRLAEAGPWWDEAAAALAQPDEQGDDVEALEARLRALDGGRMALQARARRELAAEGFPLTRTTVYRRACQILDEQAAP